MLTIESKPSKNPHLKVVTDSDKVILSKIITHLKETLNKTKIKVLAIGGGIVKPNEQYLSRHTDLEYYTLDLNNPSNLPNVIVADITDNNLNVEHTFDFIYTKDTFEHILNPWEATKNIKKMLNEKGIFFCIAPFAWRYHACPVDTYRYSHTGMRYIFEHLSEIEHVFSGYYCYEPTNGFWTDNTDATLNGQPFTVSQEVYYIGVKNKDYKFTKENLDRSSLF